MSKIIKSPEYLIPFSILYLLIFFDKPCSVMGCQFFTVFLYIPLLYLSFSFYVKGFVNQKDSLIKKLKVKTIYFLVFTFINALIIVLLHYKYIVVEFYTFFNAFGLFFIVGGIVYFLPIILGLMFSETEG